MESCFKLSAGLLLLFQTFHPMLLQNTTVSPGSAIDINLLHVSPNNAPRSQAQSVEEPSVGDQDLDTGGMASAADQTNALGFGMFAISSGENEENQEQINGTNDEGMTVITTLIPPTFSNETDTEAMESSTPAEPKNELATQFNRNTTMNNGSNSEDIFQNHANVSSEHPDDMTTNVSTFTQQSNATGVEETHGFNETNGQTDPENDIEETTSGKPNFSNTSGPNDVAASLPPNTPTEVSPPPETSVNEDGPVSMSTVVWGTTEKSNATDRDGASGESNTDRGLVSNSNRNKKNEAWAAILGTAVVVCVIALVIFVILKKKKQKDFSHRKLVEFSPDPVLRLDNSEGLEPNYGRGAYSNPALQMTSIPSRYNGPIQDGYLD